MSDELTIPPDHLIAGLCVAKPYNSELVVTAVGRLREKGARYVDLKYFPWPFCGRSTPPPETRWQELRHRADPKGDEEAKMVQVMDVIQTDNNVEIFFDAKFAGGVERMRLSARDLDWKSYAVEDRKSTRLNSSHIQKSRMPSSA